MSYDRSATQLTKQVAKKLKILILHHHVNLWAGIGHSMSGWYTPKHVVSCLTWPRQYPAKGIRRVHTLPEMILWYKRLSYRMHVQTLHKYSFRCLPIETCLDVPNIEYTITGTIAVYRPYTGSRLARTA